MHDLRKILLDIILRDATTPECLLEALVVRTDRLPRLGVLLYWAVEVIFRGETGDGRMRKRVLVMRNVVWRRPDADIDVVVLAILGKECERKG